MERLNRYINAPGMDPGSQWLNAIVGRVFYNVFRSADVERNLRLKIEKRLRAVERPFFLGKLKLVSVTGGHSLPLFNNGTLHSLSAEGELLASVGIFYPGGFRLTIASELLVGNLLAVPFVMSVYIKHLSGRVLLRIKAPPSDRLWYGFHEQPKLDIEVEPVVSSQAVTWSIVRSGIAQLLSQIISEFMVLPYMDDIPIPPLFIGNVYGGETPLPSDTDDVRSEDEFAVPESNYSKTVDHNGLPIEIGSLHAISSESGDDICRIRSFDEFPITKDDPSNVCDHTKKTSSIDICMDNLPITSLNNGRELGGLVRKHSISVPPKDIVRNSLELDTNDGVRSHPNGRDSFSDADYLLKKSESTFSSNLNDSSTTSQLTSHRLYDEARKSDLLTLHHRHRISQTSTDNDPGKPDRRDEHVPIRKRR